MSSSIYRRIFTNNQRSTFNEGGDYEITRVALGSNSTESDDFKQLKDDVQYIGRNPMGAKNYYTYNTYSIERERIKGIGIGSITSVTSSSGTVFGPSLETFVTDGIPGQGGSSPVPTIETTNVAFRLSDTGNYSEIQYTNNKGVTWSNSAGVTLGYGIYDWANNRSNKIAIYSMGGNYEVRRLAWATVTGGVPSWTTSSEAVLCLAGNANDLLLTGKATSIHRSTSWSPPGTSVATLAADPYTMAIDNGSTTAATCIAFTYAGLLYRSTNGGQNWSLVSSSTLPNFNFSGVSRRSCIYHVPSGYFYVVNISGGISKIYRSSDGLNWTLISEVSSGEESGFTALVASKSLINAYGSRFWQSGDGYQWSMIRGTTTNFWQAGWGVAGYASFDDTGWYGESTKPGGNGRNPAYGTFGSFTEITTNETSGYDNILVGLSSHLVKRSDATGSPSSIRGNVHLLDRKNKKIYLQNVSGSWSTSSSEKTIVSDEGFSDQFTGIKVGANGAAIYSNFSNLSNFTYDVFFKFTNSGTSSSNQILLDTRNTLNTQGFFTIVNSSGNLVIFNSTGTSSTTLYSSIDTEWHHLRITPTVSYLDNTSISHGFTVSSGPRVSLGSSTNGNFSVSGKVHNFRLVGTTLLNPGENYLKNTLSKVTKTYSSNQPTSY